MDEEGLRELRLASAYGLRIAANVRMQGVRPEMLLGIMVLSDLCRGSGTRALITSVLNGLHMVNSLHYVGAAIDFTIDRPEDRAAWVAELGVRLGRNFDVIDEGDHIHVEYQPHTGAPT